VLAAADLAHQADDHAGVDAVYEGEIGAEISLAFLRVSRGRGVELVEEEAVAGDEGGLVFGGPCGGVGKAGLALRWAPGRRRSVSAKAAICSWVAKENFVTAASHCLKYGVSE